MRFYVASGLKNAKRAAQFVAEIERVGHVVSYNWTTHGAVQKEGEVAEEIKERLQATAVAEMRGVTTSDIVIVLMPGGKGTHTELGLALATGCDIVLIQRPQDIQAKACVFHFAPGVERLVVDWDNCSDEYASKVISNIVEYAMNRWRYGDDQVKFSVPEGETK